MQDDNNSWDIMQDLEFLIASDCQLKDELDHVCDLLDSDSSPDELTPPTAAATASDKKKRRSRNNRYKQDILQLRAQVESLKEELLKARANTSTADMSVWELAARREQERASFIDNMKRLLCKKPRWISPRGVVADDCEWQSMVVSPNQSDSSKCRLYCLFQSPLASLVDDVKDEEESMDQLVAMVNSLSLTTRDNAKSYDATSISCPSLRAILERGHDFEKKLKSALIQVERASNSCSKRELQDD
ncbi:hypothetical protein Ae201684P_021614 [Aphanomyces euteiches]|nr:hypothetical protein Ae201684P_021614 [Aphanomyces euteiches]